MKINENLKIVGGIATGKTATLKELAIKLDNVMVLDFIGEYEDLKASFEGDKLDVINLCNPDCPKVKLSKEIIDLAKQYDFVIIDETSYLFAEEVNGFLSFLQQMKEANTKIIASFQTLPPIEIDIKFPQFIMLNR
ncbi:putative dNA polymerase III subunit gamma and TAU [Bacillus clarus]|uniref:Putative dNA polymerase III subunit gamma and TAU n=1 Tax=Bacillus clarus TaxID=2338372 RepID=A0A090Z0E3_9BACI|nr:putative dNA polymerase III subunit gamma and TAU [Bacillus clarus]